MKNITKILMATFVTFAFTAVNRAQADEPLLSPRAKDTQIRSVPGNSANEFDLAKKGERWKVKYWIIMNAPKDNRDLVSEMADLNGSPRMKSQQAPQSINIAPLK